MVDLVLLHGPPAAGKLTTAEALGALTGARVFHNHLTLDVAKSVLEFGAPGFWDLVKDLRLRALGACFRHGAGTVVTTWCYEEPADRATFDEIRSLAAAAGGRVLPAFLRCETSHLEDRVDSDGRRRMRKLCDVERLREILSRNTYRAIPDELCIEIDSGANSAASNARRVVEAFDLKLARTP